ncbi:arylacetamide deacetylase-like [Argopecten irradians]|uniref:arylacetamide deacetylase-like n=1 Tax=Argopecten irradians TaxID=31199 RepID=UPI003720D21E
MACGRVLLFLAVAFVGLAYMLYKPFPDEAVEPNAQMAISLFLTAVFKMCYLQEYIGYNTFEACARNPFNLKALMKIESDDNVTVSEELFDGVRVVLYVPRYRKEGGTLPGIIYIHGGGWTLGAPEQYDPLTRKLANSLTAVVASIDYRMAPEHPFPVPFEDCLKVTKYFMNNAKRFGVDASRVAVTGDSAGGNLAMAVGAKLTKGGQSPRLLGLIYPALQMVDFNFPAYRTYQSFPYLLTTRLMVSFYIKYAFGNDADLEKVYDNRHVTKAFRKSIESKVSASLLPEKYQKLHVKEHTNVDINLAQRMEQIISNVSLCPLLMDDDELYELPKTYLLTCEYDPLRDEGLMLAKRLKDMYFPVTHVHWDGVQHGFIAAIGQKRTEEAVDDFIKYLRKEL